MGLSVFEGGDSEGAVIGADAVVASRTGRLRFDLSSDVTEVPDGHLICFSPFNPSFLNLLTQSPLGGFFWHKDVLVAGADIKLYSPEDRAITRWKVQQDRVFPHCISYGPPTP